MFPHPADLAWRRFQQHRDGRALAIVFDCTAKDLQALARHLASPGADADDLVQATFVTAIEDAAAHRRGERILPWLVGILVNHARAARRRARRSLDAARLPQPSVEAVDEVGAHELHAELRAAIDRLPEVYRPVLRLVCEHGLSAQEIARTLERPAGTVRAQVSRGIELLRRCLPASLAGGTAVVASTGRGLAAVRAEVLARCGGTAHGFLSAVTLGGLIVLHHKLPAALAAVVLVGLGWFVFDPEPAPGTTLAAAADPLDRAQAPIDAAATAPAGSSEPQRTAASDPAPIVPTAMPASTEAPGEVVVRVVDPRGARCTGIGVALYPADEIQNLGRDARYRATDALGEVRFAALRAGEWAIDVDRAGAIATAAAVPGERTVRTVELPAGLTAHGRVRDRAGNPVPGAAIAVLGNRACHVVVATTDAAGAFVVSHLANGVELQARATGCQPSLAHPVRGAPGGEIALDLVIGGPAAEIRGRVLDPDGGAVVDAVVAVLPATAVAVDPASPGPHVRASWLRTGADGTFHCADATPGASIVFCDAGRRGFAPGWIEVDASGGTAFAELRLGRGAALAGSVRRGGMPVVGFQVFTWPLEQPRIGYLLNLFGTRYATTDRDGSFRIDGLMPARQTARVLQGASTMQQAELELRAGVTTAWHVELDAAAGLRIVVENLGMLGGLPVAAIVTNSDLRDGEMPDLVPIQPDGRGAHQRARTAPVDVVLTAFHSGTDIVQIAALRRVPAERAEVRFTLTPDLVPARSIRGRLVDAQAAPIAGETVAATKTSTDGLVARIETRTSADGAFVLGPLPAGDYTLLVGALRDAVAVGTAVLTADRDELVGDLRRAGR